MSLNEFFFSIKAEFVQSELAIGICVPFCAMYLCKVLTIIKSKYWWMLKNVEDAVSYIISHLKNVMCNLYKSKQSYMPH